MRRKKTRLVWNPDPGVLCIVRVLLLLQGGFALLSTLEGLFWGFATDFALLGLTILLTGTTTAIVLLLVAGLGRRSYLARRLVIVGEVFVILIALIDLALAVFMAGTLLDPVPMLTRLVLPVAVIALLRRSRTRVPARPDFRGTLPLGARP